MYIFQERQNVLHIKISRRAFSTISSKFRKNTYNFSGGKSWEDQIFQEILSKISLEHIRFSRRNKYHKNKWESFLKILQEQIRFSRRPYPQEQIFYKIASSDAFDNEREEPPYYLHYEINTM